MFPVKYPAEGFLKKEDMTEWNHIYIQKQHYEVVLPSLAAQRTVPRRRVGRPMHEVEAEEEIARQARHHALRYSRTTVISLIWVASHGFAWGLIPPF